MPATASEGTRRGLSRVAGPSDLQSARRIRFRRATTTSAGTRLRRCAAIACATARRKGRRPTSFAFSSGKRTQSPGKSGRTTSRLNDEKSLQIRLIQMQGRTTENRGVPGSSPGLAIAERRANSFTSVSVQSSGPWARIPWWPARRRRSSRSADQPIARMSFTEARRSRTSASPARSVRHHVLRRLTSRRKV